MRSFILSLFLGLFCFSTPSYALTKQEEVIERSALVLKSILLNSENKEIKQVLPHAKAVLVIPRMLRAGFLLGGSSGSGIMLQRTPTGWSAPAFYNLSGASLGIQAGVDSSEIIIAFMTEEAVQTILSSHSFNLGATAGLSLGVLGKGKGAELTDDVVSYSQSQGLYGGVSFKGGALSVKDKWNETFYGRALSVREILVSNKVRSPYNMTPIYNILP